MLTQLVYVELATCQSCQSIKSKTESFDFYSTFSQTISSNVSTFVANINNSTLMILWNDIASNTQRYLYFSQFISNTFQHINHYYCEKLKTCACLEVTAECPQIISKQVSSLMTQ